MAIGNDFSVNANGDIRHTSGTTTYTVLELHRWLQSLASNTSSSGDDVLDITSNNPSERLTDNIITLLNGYNINDATSEYLYGGSISQNGGNTVYYGLIVNGTVNSPTSLMVIQNNSLYNGATPFWGTGLNSDAEYDVLMQCLVKGRDSGEDIDNRRIRVMAREYGDTYSESSIKLELGNNSAFITTIQDVNNTTDASIVTTWSGISNTEGYQEIDLNNGNGLLPYFSKFDLGSYSISDLYEWSKYVTRRDSSYTLYGIPGYMFRGITHEFSYTNETHTLFTEQEIITWPNGSGVVLATTADDVGNGTVWLQLMTGRIMESSDTVTGSDSSTMASVTSVKKRNLSNCFIGQYTGDELIGAFGIGVEPLQLNSNDKLIDLNDDIQTTPVISTLTINNLVASDDIILVGPKGTGDTFQLNQLTLEVTLHASGVTSIVANEMIPEDTPKAGTIRLKMDSGIYEKVYYTDWSEDTFIIDATDFSSNPSTSGSNIMITYIDKPASSSSESISLLFKSERALLVRVRNSSVTPIKTFTSPIVLGSNGASVTVIRESDI